MANQQFGKEKPAKAPVTASRARRRRSIKIDKSAVSHLITESYDNVISERGDWNRRRLERWANLYSWKPKYYDKDGNLAPDIWLPIMATASFRLKSALEAALKAVRPI